MRCQTCNQQEATVLFTQIIDGRKNVYHLCKACAEQKSGVAVSVKAGASEKHVQPPADPVCPACGETFSEFQKTGMFGCASCYEAFASELTPLLKRIHGVGQHQVETTDTGWSRGEDLAVLKSQLEEAVAREAFEEAARLRDRITTLEAHVQDTP